MDAWSDGSHELERNLERQMRAQERQLAWVRLGMAALAAAFLGFARPEIAGREILIGIAIGLMAWSVLVLWLLGRFPAREVGIVVRQAEKGLKPVLPSQLRERDGLVRRV